MTALATFRPSGPLLRLLRLERWLCPACSRDNLLRRETTVIGRPCRWCGADLWPWPAVATTMGESIAWAFSAMAEAVARAARAFNEAMAAWKLPHREDESHGPHGRG